MGSRSFRSRQTIQKCEAPDDVKSAVKTDQAHRSDDGRSYTKLSQSYQAGQTLSLEVTRTFTEQSLAPGPFTLTCTVLGIYDVTMSPVLDIVFKDRAGTDIRAVLKLYDYRFGKDLRRDDDGKHSPHFAQAEAEYWDYVRKGKAERFLEDLAEENRKAEAQGQLEEPLHRHLDGSPEGRARYEIVLHEQCAEYFRCEAKAYDTLLDLQGKSIPRKFAHVRAPRTDLPPDLAQGKFAQFFEVPGILMERISGYRLWDMPESPLAPREPERWRGIVQAAVDVAADINTRGVIMYDCRPRNVIVDKRTHNPFLIDFAQCSFRDDPGYSKIYDADDNESEDGGDEDEEDDSEEGGSLFEDDWESLDPEARYQRDALERDNPGAIGTVMAAKLLRGHGVRMDLRYPGLGVVKGGYSQGPDDLAL